VNECDLRRSHDQFTKKKLPCSHCLFIIKKYEKFSQKYDWIDQCHLLSTYKSLDSINIYVKYYKKDKSVFGEYRLGV
jgi:hypothetical protein